MYIFSIFAIPLSFYILVLVLYPPREHAEALRTWLRGFAMSLPLVLLARAAGSLVPTMYGTILSPLHEAADRFLPYVILPGAVYSLFRHGADSDAGNPSRRNMTSFYAGALSLSGCAEIFHTVEAPSVFTLFALPFLTFSTLLAAPRFWVGLRETSRHSDPRPPFVRVALKGNPVSPAGRKGGETAFAKRVADFFLNLTMTARMRLWLYCAAVCLAASLVPGLFRHRQWFFAWPLTAGICVLSWTIAVPGLRLQD
jgi:hypothetical protein